MAGTSNIAPALTPWILTQARPRLTHLPEEPDLTYLLTLLESTAAHD